MASLTPTREELSEWILQTARHACHVEYYLKELGIGGEDPERPHDIVGQHNKFELDVMRGFAVRYRDESKEFFDREVLPSLMLHRCQHHHRMWKCPNAKACAEAMKLGATDAICSLLEPRAYQGGVHTFAQIEDVIAQSPEHNRPWLAEVLTEFRRVPSARIEHRVCTLDDIPNVGLHAHTHATIVQRVAEARQLVHDAYGYVL